MTVARRLSSDIIEALHIIPVCAGLNLIYLVAQPLVLHLSKFTLDSPLDVVEGYFLRC